MRSKLYSAFLALAAITCAAVSASGIIPIECAVTPAAERNGWVPPSPADLAKPAPQFVLSAPGPGQPTLASEGAVVKLWDCARAINGGEHFPTLRQQVGDCVAHGMAQGLHYAQAGDIFLGRAPATSFRIVDRPFIYGVSRMAPDIGNGALGSSDGSVGRWAAEAVKRYGVLAADAQGVPPYSGARSREWGSRGVPDVHYWQAALTKVRQVAQVKNYEDARDALGNYYPCTIASNIGFNDTSVVKDGKRWGRRSGSWAHQMCLIAVDDTAKSPFTGKTGACYVLNSWGPDAHGKPAGDEPPGGFWIDRDTVDAILKQGDSWAISSFDGFPARPKPSDFVLFDGPRADVAFPEEPPLLVPASQVLAHVKSEHAAGCGCLGVLTTTLLIAIERRRRRRHELAA